MEDMANNIQRYPAYIHVAEEWSSLGYDYGDEIQTEDLYQLLNIEYPGDKSLYSEASKLRLRFMQEFECLKDELLQRHAVALKPTYKNSYIILLPKEQSEYAEAELQRNLRKNLNKAMSLLLNVNFDMLTEKERQENTDATTRVAAKMALLGKKRLTTKDIFRLRGKETSDEDDEVQDQGNGTDADTQERHPGGPTASTGEGNEEAYGQAETNG